MMREAHGAWRTLVMHWVNTSRYPEYAPPRAGREGVAAAFYSSEGVAAAFYGSGGGTLRLVACSKAYASSISRGSLHAVPAKLTP